MMDEVRKHQITEFLQGLAKKGSSIGYVKLNEKLKLGVDFSDEASMEELYTALDQVSAGSYKENQVFLGLTVINKMRNRPGLRFFTGVEKILGSKIPDMDDFFEEHREKLYALYAAK